MAHPPSRSAFSSNILNPAVTSTPSPALSHHSNTPGSTGSNNNTFLMSASPVRSRRSAAEGYKPKMISTIGAKPACLVNASVTYVGDDQIYAFGGFDQYTDEGISTQSPGASLAARSRDHYQHLTEPVLT